MGQSEGGQGNSENGTTKVVASAPLALNARAGSASGSVSGLESRISAILKSQEVACDGSAAEVRWSGGAAVIGSGAARLCVLLAAGLLPDHIVDNVDARFAMGCSTEEDEEDNDDREHND